MTVVLVKPTVDAVKDAGKKFDEDNEPIEHALEALFSQFRENINPAHVLLKVTTLNDFYSTQIPLYSKRIPTVFEVANHIVKLGIDSRLGLGSSDLVYDIAKTEVANKGVHYNYSFATKYCNWHRPDFYPIYDSRVEEYLWYLQDSGLINPFQRQDLKRYYVFKEIVTGLRDGFLPERFTYKEIDKFLYYEGGKLLAAKEEEKRAAITAESQQSLSESNEDDAAKP